MALGTIILVGVVALIVSAKTVQLTFPLLLCAALLSGFFNRVFLSSVQGQ